MPVFPSESDADLSGMVLDHRYRLEERIGSGGMGVVYRGKHLQLGSDVAVKILPWSSSDDDDDDRGKRFHREARAAAQIEHENIVPVTDYGETSEGLAYLVMGLVAGRDLKRVISEDGPLPWSRARGLFIQLASALDAAHRRGIVHRDIKPSNCMVVCREEQESLKVLDFGISKFLSESSVGLEKLTATGGIIGTAAYMAPEQARGVCSPESDLYAAGVLMFETLTGMLPFRGAPHVVIAQHMSILPPRPTALRPEIPTQVERAILLCLEKSPYDRFRSARELMTALMAIPSTDAWDSDRTLVGGNEVLGSSPPLWMNRAYVGSAPVAVARSNEQRTPYQSRPSLATTAWVVLAIAILASLSIAAVVASTMWRGSVDGSSASGAPAVATAHESTGGTGGEGTEEERGELPKVGEGGIEERVGTSTGVEDDPASGSTSTTDGLPEGGDTSGEVSPKRAVRPRRHRPERTEGVEVLEALEAACAAGKRSEAIRLYRRVAPSDRATMRRRCASHDVELTQP